MTDVKKGKERGPRRKVTLDGKRLRTARETLFGTREKALEPEGDFELSTLSRAERGIAISIQNAEAIAKRVKMDLKDLAVEAASDDPAPEAEIRASTPLRGSAQNQISRDLSAIR